MEQQQSLEEHNLSTVFKEMYGVTMPDHVLSYMAKNSYKEWMKLYNRYKEKNK